MTHSIRFNSKWITDLNITVKTNKILEENIGKVLVAQGLTKIS